MKTGTRSRALLAAGLVLLGPVLSGPLGAYEWMTDKQIRNRTLDIAWEFNPRDCPAGTREMLQEASDILDFYTLTGFELRFGQQTEADAAVDGRYVVSCNTVLDYMQRGYGFQSGAVTLVAQRQGLITDADIIFNASRLNFGIALHEFSHMLGLDHSAAPHSIVCNSEKPGHCRSRGRLDADDLVGLATLYDVPANCTPFLAADMSVYFPHIGGYWAELRPVDPDDLGKGYYAAATGRSIDYEWQCNLFHSSGFNEVEADLYYRGELVEAEFFRDGGLWFVNFPDIERQAVL